MRFSETAAAKNLSLGKTSGYTAISGYGLAVEIDGKHVSARNRRLMEKEKIELGSLGEEAALMAAAGETPMFFGVDGTNLGSLPSLMKVKASSPAIKQLHALGIRPPNDHRRQ